MVKEAKYALWVLLLGAAVGYLILFYRAYLDGVERKRTSTVSEEQWGEFLDTAGCRPVRTGSTWRTVSDDGVTYTDQGSIITYNCEGRSITARQFP